ncbi:hypothetical protein T484DRAFT_2429500 [Baffinella frigidus]|nr:hypothetical protein T484DRAFT_2429500 [Cryptophyta sp. CCMP2293]
MQERAAVTVKDCKFEKCGLGIWCSEASKLSLQGSTITGNSERRPRSEDCTGLFVGEGAQADVSDCTFTNHFKAIAIRDAGSTLTGKDCAIESCLGSGVYARGEKVNVRLRSWNFSKCGEKKVSNSTTAGVTVTCGACATLEECRFVECKTSALQSTHNATIVHNNSVFVSCAQQELAFEGGRIH